MKTISRILFCLSSILILEPGLAKAQAPFPAGMGEILGVPAQDDIHFAEISKYALPTQAFLKNVFFGEKVLIESKYFAGMREKVQDHYTRSSLYKENRDSYIKRGIYQKIKSTREEDDFKKAQKLSQEYLTDFYLSAKTIKEKLELSDYDNYLDDEILSAAYTERDASIQLVLSPNKQGLDRLNFNTSQGIAVSQTDATNRPIAYYGHIKSEYIQSLIYQDAGKRLSAYTIDVEESRYVALSLSDLNDSPVCNKFGENYFFECGDPAKKQVNAPALAALLAPPKAINNTEHAEKVFAFFKNQAKDKQIDAFIENFLEDALKDLARENQDLIIDFPFMKVTQGQIDSRLLSTDPNHKAQNSTIVKDASYFPTKLKGVYYTPDQLDDYHLEFKFKNELKLLPGESIYLVLPEEFSKQPLSNVILGHRQNPKDQRGSASFDPATGKKTFDKFPAYTSVQVHSVKHAYKDSWRTWAGPVSSDKGSKFAEIKKYPEFDNLYEWPLKGHKSLRSGNLEKSPAQIDMVKIEILGDDPVYLDSVLVKVVAPRATHYVDLSLTHDRTSIGDPLTLKGRKYGGGQSYGGTFPGAFRLTPSRWRDPEYEINLNGELLKSVSIAIGDTRPDGVRNRDGGTGTPGAARVSIIIEDTNGNEIVLVDEENVGPQGVVTGYTKVSGIRAKKIIIKGHNDTSYLMGIQYGYN